AERWDGEGPHALAYPTAPLAAAGRGGAGYCGRTGPLSRPQQQGDPHAAGLLHQEQKPHGVCQAHRHEAADRERSDGKYRAACGQSALERAEPLLVSCQCRGHTPVAVVLQSGSVEHVETYGDFTPCSAGSLTGKMGTRPFLPGRLLAAPRAWAPPS